jgi:MFS family permease
LICDKASTLYNLAFSLGGAIAPILGGFLNDQIGFRSTSDVMAIAAFATTIFYLIVGILMHKDKSVEIEVGRERAASSF